MIVRVIAATVAGAIAFFAVGFLIYGMFLEPTFMRPNIHEYAGLLKDPPSWIPLILANLTIAFLLTLIFDRWAGIRTFGTGAWAGAVIVFLMTLYFDFSFFAFMRIFKNFIPLLADVAGGIVVGAIAGGIIGLVLGLMNKEKVMA